MPRERAITEIEAGVIPMARAVSETPAPLATAFAILSSRWPLAWRERSRAIARSRAASATALRAAELPRRREYGPPLPVRVGRIRRAAFDTAAPEIAATSAVSSSRAPALIALTIARSRSFSELRSALNAAWWALQAVTAAASAEVASVRDGGAPMAERYASGIRGRQPKRTKGRRRATTPDPPPIHSRFIAAPGSEPPQEAASVGPLEGAQGSTKQGWVVSSAPVRCLRTMAARPGPAHRLDRGE